MQKQIFILFIIVLFSSTGIAASEESKEKKPEAKKIKRVTFEETDETLLAIEKLVSAGASVDAADAYGDTALILAARKGSLHDVERLIDLKADLSLKNFYKRPTTALSEAAEKGHLPVVRFLVEQKAQVNYKNKVDKNPLSFAAAFSHDKVVEYLLAQKADVDAQDIDGNGALHFASMNIQPTTVRLLLLNRANRVLTNNNERNPISYAVDKEILRAFLTTSSTQKS